MNEKLIKIVKICLCGILAVLAAICIYIVYDQLTRENSVPVKEEKDIVELIKEDSAFNRTDTINTPGPIFLINAKMGDLLTVFLQKWNVVPPASVNNSDQIWALFTSDGVEALRLLGSIYNFEVNAEGETVTFSEGTNIVGTPIENTTLEFKSGGKAGEAFWNIMELEKQPFLFVLPANVILPDVETGGSVQQFLDINKLEVKNIENIWVVSKKY